ncbi:hypothetical protein HYH03_012611 [Edaphochlamys debaryana]|uniref:MAGE domain-containing protein n=1 Tax=Edaphochlamys debaryana TaxID=47281 RepID=A0A835XSE9_9CHLO|nr:hypothetical protein HYH03_012611 [Edaphochlamys debaryana]|eukprot:KAG2488812.1 hypothetical protein HYH03_012611 [Edaphochlamys debaryana]
MQTRTSRRSSAKRRNSDFEEDHEVDASGSDDADDDPPPARGRRASAAAAAANPSANKRKRGAAVRRPNKRAKDDSNDDEEEEEGTDGGSEASEGEEEEGDDELSQDGAGDEEESEDGEEEEEEDGGRGRRTRSAAAAAAPRGRGRGRGRGAATAAAPVRGRGGARGGTRAAAAAAAAASDSDGSVEVESDGEEEAGATGRGASGAAARGGAARGRGRGRARGGRGGAGATQGQGGPTQIDPDDRPEGAADADADWLAGGFGGGGGAGHRWTAADAAHAGALKFDAAELAWMRAQVRRYKEEFEVAREKCDVWGSLNVTDRDDLGRAAVRYMLYASRAKPGQAVPRAKLAEAVKGAMGKHKLFKKLTSVWLPYSRYLAISRMGLEIADISERPWAPQRNAAEAGGSSAAADGAAAAAAAAGDGEGSGVASGAYFVLRSVLPTALRREFVGDGDSGAALAHGGPLSQVDFMALTTLALALIRSNGGKSDEDSLRRNLSMVGFHPDSPLHPVYGDLDEQIKKMVEQRYLSLDKKGTTRTDAEGRPIGEYRWGDAAHSEVGEARLDAVLERFHKQLEQQRLEALDAPVEGGAE